ncbi:amino acid aminotransferase [Thalassospira sp. HJ]|uniref:aromatic amino acid transaminase n=1 Tax=Thalassospira sp. HJ TaxID=1616823 RepID=UPI0005CEF95A|nr:aromatic amino acid transaminase [Thalassospira sp. HJ]KJE35785.1 amino acid aminotransferase [Thalassospira sp. HJ]
MFEYIQDYPVDPIMIGAENFANDPRSEKIDLTVGIYQNEHGQTPVLSAVKDAERQLVASQSTKSYLALTGDATYCNLLGREILGPTYTEIDFVSAQTAGGAVALRVIADMLAQMSPQPTIWLQTPTYGNYLPILRAAGAYCRFVPYYSQSACELDFDRMIEGLKTAQPGDVFLMQGVCHNPTGADMNAKQFNFLLDLLEEKGVIPWLDLAYLGFSQSFEEDCKMARDIADRFSECVICITLSKSFGIYRDRAGALFIKTKPAYQKRVHRAVSAIIRSSASHAPDHGPSVVRTILQDAELKASWLSELAQMRDRVIQIRKLVSEAEMQQFGEGTLNFLARQTGMFSLLPITIEQETALTREHGIHVVKGGRINVARLDQNNIPKLIKAFHMVTR